MSDPFNLDFTLTFDNAANVQATTAGLTINSFNLPYAAQYAYDASTDILILATLASTSGCANPANTFCVFVSGISSLAPNVFFVQESTASGGFWRAQTINAAVRTVPEPGTVALLGLGLLSAGFAWRRRS